MVEAGQAQRKGGFQTMHTSECDLNGTRRAAVDSACNGTQPGDAPGFAAAILESLPDTAIVVDNTGRVRYLNPAAERLLGCAPGRALGRPLGDCLVLRDGCYGHIVPSPLARLLARDTCHAGQYDLLVRPDGREIPVECSSTFLSGEPGRTAGIVIMLRDATQACTTIQRLRERANHDDLTRLVNRAEFERRLANRMDQLREGETHALLYMDLDGFKAVNDSAGHAAGDAALRLVAKVFQQTVRERDTLARLGGDEFGVLLEHCPAELALQHAGELRNALANSEFRWEGHAFQLGVSIGLAMICGNGRRTAHDILVEADLACYAAKRDRGAGPRGRWVRKFATVGN